MNVTEIVQIRPLSAGRVMGVLYFGLSLVLAVPLGVFEIATGELGAELLFTLAMPFVYGACGAVAGVVLGAAYNAAASVMGGLQIGFSEER